MEKNKVRQKEESALVFSPGLPFPFLVELKTSVSTQTVVLKSREGGPLCQKARESLELLVLPWPPCLFALTPPVLRGYGTCFTERSHCAAGKKKKIKICCKYLPREGRGNAKPWPAASQTEAVKITLQYIFESTPPTPPPVPFNQFKCILSLFH